jgi:hypothetical protein
MASVADEVNQMDTDYGKNFKILNPNDQIKGKLSRRDIVSRKNRKSSRRTRKTSENFHPFRYLNCLFVLFLLSTELQTILRDKSTNRSDFKFYADRLIRLVIEESLNQLPYSECSVVTPTGAIYDGLKYRSGNCGVSIVRSGEAMEQGLRDCCRSIRIGKILVESDAETAIAKVVYARFPDDVAKRQVLLMCMKPSDNSTSEFFTFHSF